MPPYEPDFVRMQYAEVLKRAEADRLAQQVVKSRVDRSSHVERSSAMSELYIWSESLAMIRRFA